MMSQSTCHSERISVVLSTHGGANKNFMMHPPVRSTRGKAGGANVRRTHEDVNEAKWIWRTKKQTVPAAGEIRDDKSNTAYDRTPTVVAAWKAPGFWLPKAAIGRDDVENAAGNKEAVMNIGLSSQKANTGQTVKVCTTSGFSDRMYYAPGRCEDAKSSAAILEEGSVARMEDEILRVSAGIPGGHHRTLSSSTASSSSISTQRVEDWWDERSPWAWQWAESAVSCDRD